MIKAEIATVDVIKKLEGEPLRFPDEDDKDQINDTFKGLQAQIAIPAALLTEALGASSKYNYQNIQLISSLLSLDGTTLPIVNTVFRNLASVLPSVSSNEYGQLCSKLCSYINIVLI